jgi:hypothetical protein
MQKIRAAVTAVSLLFVYICNPFDFLNWSDARNTLLLSYFSGFVGLLPRARAAEAANDVVLVVVTDKDLEHDDGEKIAPSYRLQAKLIDAAAEAGAAATFMDFAYYRFRGDHEGVAALAASVDHAVESGTSTVIGPVLGDDPGLEPLRGLRQAAVKWEDNRTDDYPVTGNDGVETAAFDLYQELCGGEQPFSTLCDADFATQIVTDEGLAPLAVRWGQGSHGDLDRYWDDAGSVNTCPASPRDIGRSLAQVAQLAVDHVFYAFRTKAAQERSLETRCSYHLMIPASKILGLSPEARRAVLGHKAVFIGSAAAGSNDVIDAPGRGQLPGVSLHAMAFDNLLVNGGRYLRYPPNALLDLGLPDIVEVVLALIIVTAFILGGPYWRSLMSVASLAVAIALGFAFQTVYHWPFINMLDLGIATIATPLLVRQNPFRGGVNVPAEEVP